MAMAHDRRCVVLNGCATTNGTETEAPSRTFEGPFIRSPLAKHGLRARPADEGLEFPSIARNLVSIVPVGIAKFAI